MRRRLTGILALCLGCGVVLDSYSPAEARRPSSPGKPAERPIWARYSPEENFQRELADTPLQYRAAMIIRRNNQLARAAGDAAVAREKARAHNEYKNNMDYYRQVKVTLGGHGTLEERAARYWRYGTMRPLYLTRGLDEVYAKAQADKLRELNGPGRRR